jgi:D-arabinose 1-dehydrogenase-like Zn-dependent alcohol dehydrogenase
MSLHICCFGSKCAFGGELLRKKKDEVFEFLSQGKIKPQIFARFAPEQVRDAHTLLDSGDFIGSIILKP